MSNFSFKITDFLSFSVGLHIKPHSASDYNAVYNYITVCQACQYIFKNFFKNIPKRFFGEKSRKKVPAVLLNGGAVCYSSIPKMLFMIALSSLER